MKYRREIDGLRALAVIPVIFYHAEFHFFGGGFVGVDVFFVISGFLITSLILAEKQAGTFSLVNFYERRARRILPALFFVIICCIPFAWFLLLPSSMILFADAVVAVATFVSNILFWKTTGYFTPATEMRPLLHTWSLAVEEQYYLFFPIFLIAFWRLGNRWILAALAVFAALSLALAEWGSIDHPEAAFYLLPTRGWELLVGAIVAFFFVDLEKPRACSSLSEVGSAVGILLIAFAIFSFDKNTPFPGLYALVPTIGTALVIVFGTQSTVVGRLLGNKILVGVGLISYSAYLWHQPLFAFARHHATDQPSKALLGTLAACALVLAYLSWKYVETPFRDKRRYSRKEIFGWGAAVSGVLIVFGLIANWTTGFLYRYDDHDKYLASLQQSVAGDYVRKRFDALVMKPFDEADDRKKVLIIGDSFAKDVFNALYEGGFADDLQIATRIIPHQCGNLFIEPEAFVNKIAESDVRQCEGKGIYNDAVLRDMMNQADEIWYASAWHIWQAELIDESVLNTQLHAMKPVRVFGTKSFGKVNIKRLLSLELQERLRSTGNVNGNAIKANAILNESLDDDVFIDIHSFICGAAESSCALFSSDGNLISADGSHLTKSGAKLLGEKLTQHTSISSFVYDD